MSANHIPLYRAAEVRELDRLAIEARGIAGYTLMSRAGAAAFDVLRERWPSARRVAVFCGVGNNGGDGFVLARLAQAAGLDVQIVQVGDGERLRGDARTAAEAARASGVDPVLLTEAAIDEADVLVDALFGTGLERPVEGAWREAVEAINAQGAPVLAIDIPSGLHADTGSVLGVAVRAERTITFIGRKRGLYTGEGPEFAGAIDFADLAVPADIYAEVANDTWLLAPGPVAACLPRRSRSQHKGANGHVLVIGGDHGMGGAARLAAEAAARSGAGLVSVATQPEHVTLISGSRPELMSRGVTSALDLLALLERATVVAIGPGLGQSAWSRAMYATALASSLPMVVDADALNLLAKQRRPRGNWILTPHPGEAARLLRRTTEAVQKDRFAAAAALASNYAAVAVLKGAGTVVCHGNAFAVCPTGNPGMASGGMGDVLTGILAGLLAQGLTPVDAARAAVFVHGAAADAAAAEGERGLLALDVIDALRRPLNPCR
jgi:NAD(P)H-hydrate epimerase